MRRDARIRRVRQLLDARVMVELAARYPTAAEEHTVHLILGHIRAAAHAVALLFAVEALVLGLKGGVK